MREARSVSTSVEPAYPLRLLLNSRIPNSGTTTDAIRQRGLRTPIINTLHNRLYRLHIRLLHSYIEHHIAVSTVESPFEAVPIIFHNHKLYNAAPERRNDLEVCQRAASSLPRCMGLRHTNTLLSLCLAGWDYITYLARNITECE